MKLNIKQLIFSLLFIATILGTQTFGKLHQGMQELVPGNLIDLKGNEVSTDDIGGKIIGLYFSAGWCPPCRSFSPILKNFRDENKDDFEVVMVSADRSLKEQLTYMQDGKMEWPALPAQSFEASNLYSKFNVRGIPTLLIVSPNGKVISTNGRAEVTQNANTILSTWKSSDNFEEIKKEEDETVKDNSGNNPSIQPPAVNPEREASSMEEEIKRLKEGNAKKDAQIAELTRRTEECEKIIIDNNENCAAITDELDRAMKDLSAVLAENQTLKNQLSEALDASEACNLEVVELREKLEKCQSLNNTPYLTGWVFAGEKGWVYTDADIFPFVFVESTSSWYLYEVGSSAPRRFFNYQEQLWEEWE